MLETPAHIEQSLPLTATDLKQWAYCKRIVYYRHVMPVEFTRTYKMERGRNIEAAVEAMEKRRGFRRYGLDTGSAASVCRSNPSVWDSPESLTS